MTMKATAEMLLWVGIVLDLGFCTAVLPDIKHKAFIDECVKEHNRARSSVSPPASDMLYMSWDEALAITARAWARRCQFKHNIYLKQVHRVHPNFSSVGENIWTGTHPSLFNVSRAIQMWVDEKQHYNYDSKVCSEVCGHYTQVVWATSYKVGCAVELCPKGVEKFLDKEAAVFVCNYSPAGNVNGELPYLSQGPACSGCKETCENALCRSQKRDSQQTYNWVPDWDTSIPFTSSYANILIVRPIALILSFCAAYAVCHFYPNIFFYE